MKKNNFKNKIMMSAAIGTGVAMLIPGSLAFAETTQAHNMVKHTAQQQQGVKQNQQMEGIVNFTGGPFTYITREPNWNNDGVGKLYNGAHVKIIGQTNSWYKIAYNGGIAWICKDRVEAFNVASMNKTGIVDFKGGPFTYITSKPDWNNSGVGELYNGSPVRITGENGNWYQIAYNGGTAWICKDRVNTEIKTLNETGVVNFKDGSFTYITREPNWNNDGVGALNNGTSITITGEYGNWYRINHNGNSAWICKDRVQMFDVTPVNKTGIVNFTGGAFTYITSKPNWNNSGIGKLYNGSPVRVIGESGSWYQIKYNGGIAWICKDRVNTEVKTLNKTGVVNFGGDTFTYITSQPNWNNDGIGALNNGTKINIVGEYGNWYEISHNGGTAWICKDRVLFPNEIKEMKATGVINVAEGQKSQVHNLPNLSSGALEQLANGEVVQITGECNNWYRIECKENGKQNVWVLKNTVEITSNIKKVDKIKGTVDFKGGKFTYITREPNWNNDGVGALNNGTTVTIVGESGNWYQIEYKGETAWICKDRVNVKTEIKPTVKVTPAKPETSKDGSKKAETTAKPETKTTESNKSKTEVKPETSKEGSKKAETTAKPEAKTTESNKSKTEVKPETSKDGSKKAETTAKPEAKTTESNKSKTEVKPETSKEGSKKAETTAKPEVKTTESNKSKTEVKALNENGTIDYKLGNTTYIVKSTNWKSDKVIEISNGNKVKIIGESGDWYKVEYKNKTGWIKKDRVTVDNTAVNKNNNNVVATSTTAKTIENGNTKDIK